MAYRVEGLTATVPDDVDGASGTLTFGPGAGPQELSVAAHGDTTPEQTESFRLVLEVPEASDGRPVLIGDTTTAVIVDDAAVTDDDAPPSCAAVAPILTRLWPPNLKMVTIGVDGATDPDGDAVTVAVTGVTQDEAVNGTGGGNTSPDAQLGPAPNQVRLRAERSGTGDGRVYRLAVTATDVQGASCTTVVTVAVPHNQWGGEGPEEGGHRQGTTKDEAAPRRAVARVNTEGDRTASRNRPEGLVAVAKVSPARSRGLGLGQTAQEKPAVGRPYEAFSDPGIPLIVELEATITHQP